MRKNKLRWFEHVQRRNNDDIVKRIGTIRIEENRGRNRLKKKQMGVVGEDVRAYGIDENKVSDGKR